MIPSARFWQSRLPAIAQNSQIAELQKRFRWWPKPVAGHEFCYVFRQLGSLIPVTIA